MKYLIRLQNVYNAAVHIRQRLDKPSTNCTILFERIRDSE